PATYPRSLPAALPISLAAARQSDAALDACYLALSFAPDDPDVHLALIDLYLARGWRGQAADKLVLLRRLVELTDDAAAKERVAADRKSTRLNSSHRTI